jgi:hypothetical protein
MDPSTITGSTFTLLNSSSGSVSATVTYDAATSTTTLTPNGPLAAGTTFTATVKGGAGGVKDTAGNALAADVTWSFTTGGGFNCPCSIWSTSTTPGTPAFNDSSGVEVGVKFRADADGFITGIRFYKGTGNTGTHIGNLWSAGGTKLGTATFTNETATGWQQVSFSSPVAITANTVYVASYFAPAGHYALNSQAFASAGVDNAPLHALQDGVSGSNGVYSYGAASTFPTSSFNSSNYWVDVVYTTAGADTTPPVVTAFTPASGATVSSSTTVTATFSEAVDQTTLNSNTFQLRTSAGSLIGGSISFNTTSLVATLTPSNPLASSSSFTATVKGGTTDPRVKDLSGNALAANVTWSFSTTADTTPPTVTSTSPASGATNVATTAQVIVRFSKPMTTSTISGSTIQLRDASNNLVSATVSYDSTNNTATLGPTALLAGSATYTATVSGGSNGVKDAAGNALAANFVWSFTTGVVDTTPPTVTSTTPAGNATGVATTATVNATFSEALDPTTVTATTFKLANGATAVTATVAYNGSTNTATLTPSAALAASTTYTATLTGGSSGIKDVAGNALAANFTWSFTTAAGPSCPCSAFPATATPGTAAANDSSAVEVGVKFRSDVAGFITGIRFYKGTGNNGTHVGNLWTTGGARLATANFTNETATGWQQVNFATPVAVTANTVYVASYFAPVGHYAVNNNYFGTAGVDNPPLHLLQNGVSGSNGVYLYSASSAFPTASFNSSNYWVDVVFNTSSGDTTPPTVSSTTPPNNATGVATTATVNATFSEALDPTTVNGTTFKLANGATAVTATVAYNGATNTATLTPSAALAASTTYTATLTGGSSGIKDVAGNALAANFTWSFTTGAGTGCGAGGNAIVVENCQTGNPSTEWDFTGVGDTSIQGFATQFSVNRGTTISFKVNTNASAYRFDVYRMGYYNGMGARKVATFNPSATLPQNQPACLNDPATGLNDCGNWAVSGSWAVPATAVSGIYFAKITRTDTNGASHIFFIVRNDSSTSDLIYQTSDTTWQAYNNWGGNSLYAGVPGTGPNRAYKVSYNRPFNTRVVDNGQDFVWNAEYPFIRWIEANGYDVSYMSGADTDRAGNLIVNHKAFLSVGHDEYWSAAQRANVEAARAAGVNLGFFSGNEVFWKTRWENSIDGSGTAYRTLVCYKETHANAVIDPSDPPTWTGTWRDPRFSPPADGGHPENALAGTWYLVNDGATTSIVVPAADGKMRFWRNTSIATLAAGTSATLPNGTLGYEWDSDTDNGFRPPGLVRMSTTTVNNAPALQDYGSTYASATVTHYLMFYKHASGAKVFGAGTVQWSWGLDATHDRSGTPSDPRMQQATVNILADLGAQPQTLQSGLVTATASTDTTAPASTITAPTAGASLPAGTAVTVSGTATDTGGQVGAVEVSFDGGTTWHPANGRASWTYSWTPSTTGSVNIKSRAVDDSGNIETPSAGVTVTVTGGNASCPCTIWPSSTTPTTPTTSDSGSVNLGVKFTTDTAGTISGIRFYKGSGNTGTHIGALWNSSGQLLASATFTNETASGWQQVSFTTPVNVTANTVYVASYLAPVGHYAADAGYFATTGFDNAPLHALRDGVSGGDGVYQYSSGNAFPSATFQSTNYWVDVVFNGGTDTTPPTVTVMSPANGATNVATTTTVSATFSEALNAATVTNSTFTLAAGATGITATVAYNSANNTATLTPSAALAPSTTYTATLTGGSNGIKDVAGNPLAANVAWSFTTGVADTTPPTVNSTTPANNATGIATSTTVSAVFSEALNAATVTNTTFTLAAGATAVTATVAYNSANNTATLTPSAALAPSTIYTATLTGGSSGIKDLAGNALAANFTWSFTTAAGPTCPCSAFPATATPGTAAANDSSAVELGVKFRSDRAGTITGIRFYKGAGNTGTHVAHLWDSSGNLLATATFTNETGTGWQQVNFPAVSIAASTVYVASYFAPVGHYAADNSYFASAGVDNAPLHLLQNGVSGGNGVYRYGSPGAFPTSTFQSSNYWVDVVFQ